MTTSCSDSELADSLRTHIAQGREHLLVVANKFVVRVLAARSTTDDDWLEVGQGDLAEETAKILEQAGKQNRLLWVETTDSAPLFTDYRSQTPLKVTTSYVKAWQKTRDAVTQAGGRQGEVDAKTRFEVASLAGWRCQLDGCGEDLRHHFVPGASGNYGYFAHIVASSSDGPRGDKTHSARLANDPTNIMLMCDKCHRLIDRIAPNRYGVELLSEMREKSVGEVRRLLDSLRFPAAQMLVIGGNIEGQSFAFDERVAEEAMWLHRLRSATPRAEWFARNGSHLGASNSNVYWLSLLELLRTDIPRLKGLLYGTTHGGAQRAPLAVFPLHGTSVLVLSGRLVGESSTVQLFQFHRDQVAGNRGGQWAWLDCPKPATDKFKVHVHRVAEDGEVEALLQVNLTVSPPSSELPAHLFAGGAYVLPTIEVTVDRPSYRVMEHPDDLELVGRAVGDALQIIQDQWRVRIVHLVVMGPATACFRLGQKMQARHQADFVLYERRLGAAQGAWGPFEPTIQISSTEVILPSTGESASIS